MGAPGKTGMEERMEEPYIEGVATHVVPESCARFRKEVGEALTVARLTKFRALLNATGRAFALSSPSRIDRQLPAPRI